jgi:hypothetical protein
VFALILRPFGTKGGIDFDRVERELVMPALSMLSISSRTSFGIVEGGNIRTDVLGPVFS